MGVEISIFNVKRINYGELRPLCIKHIVLILSIGHEKGKKTLINENLLSFL